MFLLIFHEPQHVLIPKTGLDIPNVVLLAITGDIFARTAIFAYIITRQFLYKQNYDTQGFFDAIV